MKLLVAVSAYSGDRDQVETNFECYAHHGAPVLILSPADAPIEDVAGAECATAGKAGWIGKHTLERQRLFLKILLDEGADFVLFNDADSVCLSPKIPRYLYDNPNIFWSNEVLDTNPAPSRLPKLAFQPPYFLSRGVIRAMLRVAATPALSFMEKSPKGWPLPLPTQCIDHWMLQVVYAAGIRHRGFPDGASFETKSEHGLNTMKDHVGRQGKVFIHQVKTKSVLDSLLESRLSYLKTYLHQ